MTTKEKPYIELPSFVPNDKQIAGYDLTHEKTYKIPVNYGVGLKWHDKDGDLFESVVTSIDFKDGKRVAQLVESNFLFSIGASHYYADVEVHGTLVYNHAEKKIYACAGYGPEREKVDPFIGWIRVKAQRRLTKVEKDGSGEKLGKIGDLTYRFNTEAEAKAAGIKTFLSRFAPGWILQSDQDCGVFLAET